MTQYNINEPMKRSGKEAITPKGEAIMMGAGLPPSRANHYHTTDYEKEGIQLSGRVVASRSMSSKAHAVLRNHR